MTSKRWLGLAAVAVFASLLAPAVLVAQSGTGFIDGRVFDESRAVVPGATVTAKNVGTGLSRSAVVSTTGTFRISSLPAGPYDVTVELTGFATQVMKGVEIRVDSGATVDFTMKLATVEETIEVTAEVSLVETTTSDVSEVITSKMVENMPLNGRRFQDLSLLVPGTRNANYYDPTKTEVGGISYGGAGGRNVVINVDGGDNNDGVVRGLLQQFSAEAIQEYKVTTQRSTAEYGRSTGGVVNVITKSGTNEFHGGAFYQWRDERLNAPTYFEDEQGIEKQPFQQQQFGATLGGPIQKDKAFFFLSYERNMRDDNAVVDTGGALPAEEGPQPQPFRNNLLTAKLNFLMGSRNDLQLRYSLEDQKRENDFIGGNVLASSGALNTNKIHSALAKNTTTIGADKVNELLVLYQAFENNIIANDNSRPGIQTPDFFYGANLNTPQQTIQKRWQLRDDFAFRKEGWGGDHQFKVGAEMIKSHYGGFFTPTLYGFFNFSSSLPTLEDYLNTIADSFTGSAGDNAFDDNWTYLGVYVQDDWKPSSQLTINLGLRYEVQWGPYQNNFDTPPLRVLAAAGYPTERSTDMNNVGPRVGFVYDLKGDAKTVIRGGYGRYYDEIFSNITLYEYWSQVDSPTFFVAATPPAFTPAEYAANREAIRASFIDPSFAGQLLRLTAPDLKQPKSDQMNLGMSQRLGKHAAFDLDYVFAHSTEIIHRWRINQASNLSDRLSPVGVFAPEYGAILVEGNRGRSNFHGVYLTGKVYSDTIYLVTTYSWSWAKDLANGFGSQPADVSNMNDDIDYNWTLEDVRHRVTVAGVWQLPVGFQLSTSFQWNTGKPFSAGAGLAGLRNAVRATDAATGEMFPRNECVIDGVDECRADPFLSWDLRLSYIRDLGKGRSFEIFGQVFNITDHANFDRDSYQSRFASATFGEPTDIIKNTQRQAEIGARFRF